MLLRSEVLAAEGAAFPYVESASSVSTSTRISEGGRCTSIGAGVGVVAADVVSSIYLAGGERDDDDALMRERGRSDSRDGLAIH